MTRIAHLTDLHLLEPTHVARTLAERIRLSLLTAGRTIDPQLHRKRCADALAAAHRSGAAHLVITGDLTEDGLHEQYEALAELLAESPWSPDRVTLVPGNHDVYARPDAFTCALEGPLRAFAETSTPGAIVDLAGVRVVAISTAISQPYWRAAGAIDHAQLEALDATLDDEQPVLLAMHHPPVAFGLRLSWLEGLAERDAFRGMLRRHRSAHVACGHMHESGDHFLEGERTPRIFAARAVVEDPAPLRVYDVFAGSIRPADEAADPASVRVLIAAALTDTGMEI